MEVYKSSVLWGSRYIPFRLGTSECSGEENINLTVKRVGVRDFGMWTSECGGEETAAVSSGRVSILRRVFLGTPLSFEMSFPCQHLALHANRVGIWSRLVLLGAIKAVCSAPVNAEGGNAWLASMAKFSLQLWRN